MVRIDLNKLSKGIYLIKPSKGSVQRFIKE